MADTLVGIVTFGNTEFTKLTYKSILDTTKEHDLDFFFIVGKPGDSETIEFLDSIECKYVVHERNWGFPYSLNDIYDYAWVMHNYKNLIIAGNDIIAYPYAIDSLINLADSSDYVCISSLQVDVRELSNKFPEVAHYFNGEGKIFTDFSATPWDVFKNYSPEPAILDMQLFDIQNLCLYKREVFDSIGYTDVNFYPAYFVDNDYALRIWRAGLKTATLANSRFFHFWSRTIYQGSGGSNSTAFELNRKYYQSKWVGIPSCELLNPDIKIMSRDKEKYYLDMWIKKLGK